MRFELWEKNTIGFDDFLGEITAIDLRLNIKYPLKWIEYKFNI